MESLQQHIEHLGLALKAQFFAHPSWAYLIIILVFIIYLVGIICDKDWAVRSAGHYSGWHVIEDFLRPLRKPTSLQLAPSCLENRSL